MLPAVGIRVAKNHVRDQLLETWIFFHLGSWPIADLFAAKQSVEISIDIRRKALKMTKLVKDGGWNYQNAFSFDDRHVLPFGGVRIQPLMMLKIGGVEKWGRKEWIFPQLKEPQSRQGARPQRLIFSFSSIRVLALDVSSQNEHRIAITIKAILFFNGLFIGTL